MPYNDSLTRYFHTYIPVYQFHTIYIYQKELPTSYLLPTRFVPSSYLLRSRLGSIERRTSVANTNKMGRNNRQNGKIANNQPIWEFMRTKACLAIILHRNTGKSNNLTLYRQKNFLICLQSRDLYILLQPKSRDKLTKRFKKDLFRIHFLKPISH